MAKTNDELSDNIRKIGILYEDSQNDIKKILEIAGDMQKSIKSLAKQSDLEEVKADVKTIRAALTDTNKQVHDHEKRITRLEVSAHR